MMYIHKQKLLLPHESRNKHMLNGLKSAAKTSVTLLALSAIVATLAYTMLGFLGLQ